MEMRNHNMEYGCRFDFATPTYEESVSLRYEVLRKPLGLIFLQEQLEEEWNQWHLGWFSPMDEMMGCLILVSSANTIFKMRQVAVRENLQGRGIGKKLVRFSEQVALSSCAERMVLHARMTTVPFYESLGYKKTSAIFEEIGIPHVKMEKIMLHSGSSL